MPQDNNYLDYINQEVNILNNILFDEDIRNIDDDYLDYINQEVNILNDKI